MDGDRAKVNHQNPLWRYQDARGVEHLGHVETSANYGGTDSVLSFRDCETGEWSAVSGERLRKAVRIWDTCRVLEAAWAEHGGEEED